MNPIDIIILSCCIIGLVYFAIDRFKYRDINVYHEKLERLNELRKLITAIENENVETENIIKSINLDNDFNDELTDKLIKNRDNEYKLSSLKDEQRKIELYIKNFRMYNKNIRI